ncbi:MAG: hypothetical protein HC830_09520 [Bacteroidetes bacterium]|nr:hypothetical protein [Bacteroidota bacterium]
MSARRTFLKTFAVSMAACSLFPKRAIGIMNPGNVNFPIRQITKGPKFHWFGYYDKLQIDPTGRFVLAIQTGFKGRTPASGDVVKIGYIDTKMNNRWKEVGESRSWGWQQGCMLQWLPGSDREIIWNDCVNGQFVAHIVDIGSEKNAPYHLHICPFDPMVKRL